MCDAFIEFGVKWGVADVEHIVLCRMSETLPTRLSARKNTRMAMRRRLYRVVE